MEGEEPAFLDDFILDAQHREVVFSHTFHPIKDRWEATLYYLVTPLRGYGEYLMKSGVLVSDFYFKNRRWFDIII